MRPIFLGLLGAAAAQYLQVVNDYLYTRGYLHSVGSLFAVKADEYDVTAKDYDPEAGIDFDYENGKLVVPSGTLGYREDGRVVVGGSEIPVSTFYIGEGDTAGIVPLDTAPYSFYICDPEEAVGVLYLYYINPDVYWNETDIDNGGSDNGGISTDDEGTDNGGISTDDVGNGGMGTEILTPNFIDPVETLPAEIPGERGGERLASSDVTVPTITNPPELRHVRRVKLSVADPAQLYHVKDWMCRMVSLQLVPTTEPSPCSTDDPTCLSLSCTTRCVGASCIPDALLDPLAVYITHCPPETCTTMCSDVSCASGASCAPSCTTECDINICYTIYATDRPTASGWVPEWTVLCPDNVCVDVCTGCNSRGCKPLCTTSCRADTGPTDTGPTDTGPTDTGPTDTSKPDTGVPTVTSTPDPGKDTCRGTTCPTVTVILGCPTCVHTFTDWVFTFPLVTTITISTFTQNTCSPKTMTFLPGTHTVPGTAVVPVKSNILLTITGGTGGTGGTGTTKTGGSGSAGTTTKPSGSGSGSTTAGNDASRNSLLGTFVGAVLFGLLM